jgi:hypothetical protein
VFAKYKIHLIKDEKIKDCVSSAAASIPSKYHKQSSQISEKPYPVTILATPTFPFEIQIRRMVKHGCFAKVRPLHGSCIAPVRHWNLDFKRIKKLVGAVDVWPTFASFQK